MIPINQSMLIVKSLSATKQGLRHSVVHYLIFGLLLGWGAAIPIGPMNIEIIRRNLNLGMRYGLAFGAGACSSDVTYLVLLSLGMLGVLQHPAAMKMITFAGALILAWFGYGALRMRSKSADGQPNLKTQTVYKHYVSGYIMTLVNPYTVIFWLSVSAQVASLSMASHFAVLYAGAGVLLGAFSWALGLNMVLHFTRHRVSVKTMHKLNLLGGIILIGFAVIGFYRVFA